MRNHTRRRQVSETTPGRREQLTRGQLCAEIQAGRLSIPPGPDVPDPIASRELGINPNDPGAPKCTRVAGLVLEAPPA
jgi:hypothetical protein